LTRAKWRWPAPFAPRALPRFITITEQSAPDFVGRAPQDDESEQALPPQHGHPDQDEGLPKFHPGGSAAAGVQLAMTVNE
jgi:hypothetical protein